MNDNETLNHLNTSLYKYNKYVSLSYLSTRGEIY